MYFFFGLSTMLLTNLSCRQYTSSLYQKGRPVLHMVFLSNEYASFWIVLDRLGFFYSVDWMCVSV